MKYVVMMSCGHEETIDLIGKNADRDKRIKYLEQNGLCKECYKKEMQEKDRNEPFSFHATALPYIDKKTGSILVNVWFAGNTMPHKDDIKTLKTRYSWGERKSAMDHIATTRPPLCWNTTIALDALQEEMESAKSIGAECIALEAGLFAEVNYQIAVNKHKEWEETHAKIAAIEKPSIPDILKDHRWNQKVYGKAGNYSIYLDSKKVDISDEQASEIKSYLKQKEDYDRQILDM